MSVMVLIAYCQGKVHYAYDNAGNRVKREIVVNTRAAAEVFLLKK